MFDTGSDATDGATRSIDYLKSALMNLHLWLIAGFLAVTAWHAYSSPAIAISAGAIELLLAVIAVAAIALAVHGTRKGARKVRR